MPAARVEKYGPEVQKVPADAPLADILYLLKRDGGVFVKNLVSEEDVDKACDDVKERLDADVEWEGAFFPSESRVSISICEKCLLM